MPLCVKPMLEWSPPVPSYMLKLAAELPTQVTLMNNDWGPESSPMWWQSTGSTTWVAISARHQIMYVMDGLWQDRLLWPEDLHLLTMNYFASLANAPAPTFSSNTLIPTVAPHITYAPSSITKHQWCYCQSSKQPQHQIIFCQQNRKSHQLTNMHYPQFPFPESCAYWRTTLVASRGEHLLAKQFINWPLCAKGTLLPSAEAIAALPHYSTTCWFDEWPAQLTGKLYSLTA